jgi:RHS repeat-associated protein
MREVKQNINRRMKIYLTLLLLLLLGYNSNATNTPPIYLTGPSSGTVGSQATYVYDNGSTVYNMTWYVPAFASKVSETQSGTAYTLVVQWIGTGSGVIQANEDIDILLPGNTKSVSASGSATPPTPVSNFSITHHCNGTATVSRSSGPEQWYSWYWQTSAGGTSTALGAGSTIGISGSTTLYLRARSNFSPYPWSASSAGGTTFVPHQPTSAGTISGDQSICYGTNAGGLTSIVSGSGGAGPSYSWERSTDNSSWSAVGIYTESLAAPPPLVGGASQNYFRRRTSTSCGDALSNTITINVYPQLNAGSISGETTICYNQAATVSNAGLASGGSGTISYQWQNLSGGTWYNMDGVTGTSIPSMNYTNTVTVRRAMSNSCGTAYTSPITITVRQPLSSGTAGANQTICAGTAPASLSNTSSPSGGDGNYAYVWRSSSDNVNWSAPIGGATGASYSPPALTSSTYYRREVSSCFQTFASNTVSITVTPLPVGGAISANQTICASATPAQLNNDDSGVGSAQWEQSLNNSTFTDISGATSKWYAPSALSQTTYFRRRAYNSCGIAHSNTITVTVYSTLATGAISAPASVCYNNAVSLGNTTSASGNTGSYTYSWEKNENGAGWVPATGSTNSATYTTPSGLTINTAFRRKVTTACTSDYTTSVSVTANPALTPGTVSANQQLCSGASAAAITSSGVSGGNSSYSYQWQSSPNNTTFTNITTNGTNASYSPGAIGTTTYYRLQVTSCGQTLPTSNSVQVFVNATPTPPTLTLVNVICGSGSTTITASDPGAGNEIKWYLVPDGGNPMHTGLTYATGTLSVNTARYALARNAETGCQSSRTEKLINISPVPAAPTGIDTTRCGFGPGTLRATPAAGADGIRWYSSPAEGVEVHADGQFETEANETTYYYAASHVSSSGCISTARTPVTIIINPLPTAIVAQIADVYGSGSVPLRAQHFVGDERESYFPSLADTIDFQFYWYVDAAHANAHSPIAAKGILYNTPPIAQSKEFYARIRDEETNCLSDVIPVMATLTPYIIPQNVRTEVIRIAGVYDDNAIEALNETQKTTSFTYMDGVGRVHQQVIKKASPSGKDLIQPVDFDQFGRASKTYLPYVDTTTTGAFHSSYQVEQANFYQASNDKIANDSHPYALAVYEDSPLGRVVEQGSVGQAWQPGTGRTGRVVYGFNTGATSDQAEEVRKFNPNGTSTEFYGANILTRVETIDADTGKVITFYDPEGKVIATKQQLGELIDGVQVNYLETYYIYDDFGRVRFLIQPKGVAALKTASPAWTFGQSIRDQFVFEYVYDNLSRVIEKKVPGAGWSYIVYDKLDRPVLLQDVMLRNTYQWTFMKYDSKGRVIMSGLYTDVFATRQSLQNIMNLKDYDGADKYFEVRQVSTAHGYSNQAFPTANTEILTVSYYDSHDFNYDQTPDKTYTSQGLSGEGVTGFLMGRVTGSKTKILGSTNWLTKYVFYDVNGRVIQVRGNNPMNTNTDDLTTMVYDFEKVLVTKNDHNAGPGNVVSTTNEMEYDVKGRSKKIYQNNNGAGKQLLAQYEYNELGQVVDKKLHGTGSPGSETFLQSVDYRYTINGQLMSINNAELNTNASNDDSNDYFGMELLYNATDDDGLSTLKKYNGNIAAIKWKSLGVAAGPNGQKSYAFRYDKSGRLEKASYSVKSATGWNGETGALNESMAYDHNGNITKLQRAQRKHAFVNDLPVYISETIDNLTYTYDSLSANSLKRVNDAASATTGFKNGSGAGKEYSYDNAGNLIADKNKGIDSVKYNFMGKPVRIKFSDGKAIVYNYDASGNKIKQRLYQGSSLQTTTDYVNGFVYENGVLSFYGSPEGRVNSTSIAWTDDATTATQYTPYVMGGEPPTVTAITQNDRTYVKVVSGSGFGYAGVFPIGGNHAVQSGDTYTLSVKGYRNTTQPFFIVVRTNLGDLVSFGPALPEGSQNEGWASVTFTIPSGATYVAFGAQWSLIFSGAEAYIEKVELRKVVKEYQYAIADHQGNTRIVFSSVTPEVKVSTANFESTTNTEFQNYPQGANRSGVEWYNSTSPSGVNTYSQLLTGGSNSQVGVAKTFKVYPGDKLKIEANAKYFTGQSGSPNLAGFAAALTGAFGLTAGVPGEAGLAYEAVNDYGAFVASGEGPGSASYPKAFVTILLFDKDHNFVDVAYDQIDGGEQPVGSSSKTAHDQMMKEISITEAGFAYVYISNENPTFVQVYFDDVKISYTPTNVIQYNEYYPFGLQASTSWTRENNSNNYLYNAGSEINTSSGWYDLPYRNYDAALGRFMQVDPLAVVDNSTSPFAYGGNNPIAFNDPSGLLKATTGQLARFINRALSGNGGRWSESSESPTYYDNEDEALAGGMSYMDQYSMWGGGGGVFAASREFAMLSYALHTTPLNQMVASLDRRPMSAFQSNLNAITGDPLALGMIAEMADDTYKLRVLHSAADSFGWDWFIETQSHGNNRYTQTAVMIFYNTNPEDWKTPEYGKVIGRIEKSRFIYTDASGWNSRDIEYQPTLDMLEMIDAAIEYHSYHGQTVLDKYVEFIFSPGNSSVPNPLDYIIPKRRVNRLNGTSAPHR